MLSDFFNNKKTGLHVLWGLVFFVTIIACSEKEKQSISIQWKDNRAESISIPLKLLGNTPADSIEKRLHIQLLNSNTPVLGEYTVTGDVLLFRPLIAFTRGLKYEVRLSGGLLDEIEIPADSAANAPAVIAVYPSADSLPLNLLKMYVAFSKPMQEGQALQNITVIKNEKDTIPSVFLDLQPELWNKERTMLTLWLDPGRIKRELQPNQLMGPPLEEGASYQLIIKKDWRDAEGIELSLAYNKHFIVGKRDSICPDPAKWTIRLPKRGSKEPLKTELHEPLDYVLLKNAIRITDKNGNTVNGIIETEAGESILNFIPATVWAPGDYTIEIESRLEDHAGNNLNRLFDKELKKQTKSNQKEIYKRPFHIR